ncbi:MAG TPA: helix-turn-helix domain-containing protein [Candidatus Udaeobacter sp.]|nr:helix-turn-helix domain-containing protein [Candidatus Udaeobacter sp.]
MQLLTLQEAMNVFGVSRATIDRWRHNKQLPFIKIGKEVFIDAKQLETWIRSYSTSVKTDTGHERKTLRVAIGYQSGTAHMWSPLIIKYVGLFEEELRRFYPDHLLDIDWHNGSNGLELVEGLVTGKLNIASLGDYPITISGNLSKILPSFQSVLLAFDGKTPNGKGISVVVHPSSSIESLSDLSNATISTVAHSSAGYRLHQLLSSLGHYEAPIIHRDMGDCLDGIRERRVGASVMWEPYLSLLKESGSGKILHEEGLGTDYLTGVVADERWARDNETIVIAYLKAHLRAHHMIRNEFDKVVTIIHLATGFSIPVIHRVLSGVRWDAAIYARDLQTLEHLESPGSASFTDDKGISIRMNYLQSAFEQLRLPLLPDAPIKGAWSSEFVY